MSHVLEHECAQLPSIYWEDQLMWYIFTMLLCRNIVYHTQNVLGYQHKYKYKYVYKDSANVFLCYVQGSLGYILCVYRNRTVKNECSNWTSRLLYGWYVVHSCRVQISFALRQTYCHNAYMRMSLDSNKIQFLRIYQMGLKLRHLQTYEFSQHDKLLLMVLTIGCGKLDR